MKENWLCRCDLCAQERYKGELCYRIGEAVICPDCLSLFALRYFRSALVLL